MTRRRFSRKEKNWLYRMTGGCCAICGAQLEAGWHGDHIVPFSRGGATDVRNGQALCEACNLKKGVNVTTDYRRRPHQIRSRQVIELAMATGQKIVFSNAEPGSGKTNNALDAGSLAIAADYADYLVYVAPRVNLCEQVEESAKKVWGETDGGSRLALAYRENVAPLFRTVELGGRTVRQNAYATTYASLIAQPKLHRDELSGKRFVLVLDEAQQLGADDERATQSTQVVEQLSQMAVLTYVMSGTATRSDGQPVFGAKYGDADPEKDGLRPLLADHTATYREGVAHKYLRPFDFVLVDGQAEWVEIGGETETLRLGEMTSGMRRVIWHPGYWQPMVDQTVETVNETKFDDSRFRGLIAAGTQAQARDIMGYLADRHPRTRALLAVSDEQMARHNLKLFKPDNAPYDLLVTVQMAYVGYDCPWIMTVCLLSDIRWRGFLDQLFARGWRLTDKAPIECQTMRAIMPGDQLAVEYALAKREDAEDGLRQRDRREGPTGPGPGPTAPALGYAADAETTDRSVIGISPSGDIAASEFGFIETVRKEYRLTGPASELMRLFRDKGLVPGPSGGPVADGGRTRPPMTQQDREKQARNAVNKEFLKYDRRLINMGYPGSKYGTTALNWKAHNAGCGLPQSTMDDIQRAEQWLTTVWAPWVDEVCRDLARY
jgi:superfamily II DNA or RNA helicase